MNSVKFSISSLPEETVLGLDCEKFLITDIAWFWINLLRKANVQVADGVLLRFPTTLSGFPAEDDKSIISMIKMFKELT